jgi:hypothetical protein
MSHYRKIPATETTHICHSGTLSHEASWRRLHTPPSLQTGQPCPSVDSSCDSPFPVQLSAERLENSTFPAPSAHTHSRALSAQRTQGSGDPIFPQEMKPVLVSDGTIRSPFINRWPFYPQTSLEKLPRTALPLNKFPSSKTAPPLPETAAHARTSLPSPFYKSHAWSRFAAVPSFPQPAWQFRPAIKLCSMDVRLFS